MSKRKQPNQKKMAAAPSIHQKRRSIAVVLPSYAQRSDLSEEWLNIGGLTWLEEGEELPQTERICFIRNKSVLGSARVLAILNRAVKGLPEGVAVPVMPAPNSSSSVTKRIGFALTGAVERLFSGIEAHHAEHDLAFYPTDAYQKTIEAYPAYSQVRGLALTRQMYTMGSEIYTLPVANMPHPATPMLKAALKGFRDKLKLIYEENLVLPLKSRFDFSELLSNSHYLGHRSVFMFVLLTALITMLYTSKDYNVTWDEETNQESAELIYNYLTTFGNDTAMFNFAEGRNRYTNQHYGMSFDVFAVAVQKWVLRVNPQANIYLIRHVLNALVGFLILLFVGLLAWRWAGPGAGVLAVVILYFSPSFFGHSFNNPKDIPFAFGFVMGVYYLSRVIMEWPKPRMQSRIMLSVGLGYCLSIRAGGLLLFAFVVLFLGILWLTRLKQSRSLIPYLRYGLPVLILGYLLGIMFWPYALRQPLTGPFKALQEFENFSHLTYYELYDGVRMYLKPWHYIPKYIAITAPWISIVGIPLALFMLWRNRLKGLNTMQIAMTFLVFSSVFPVAYTIYKGSYLYNGWRHMLFVYPGLVVLAVWGWSQLMSVFQARGWKLSVLFLALFLLAPTAIWSVRNHPYQYMYFNEMVGGIKGAQGKYELDYWNQTPRAAMEWIAQNKPELFKGKTPVKSNNPVETLKTFVPGSDSMMYRWTREYEWTKTDWEYAIFTHRTLNYNQIVGGYWPPAGTLYTVDVAGVPVCAVIERPSMYGWKGHAALEAKNLDSAVYYFNKALELEPLEEEYYRGLGSAYRMKGRFADAAAAYNKALEIRDGNYEAYFALGDIYYNQAIMDANNIDEAKLVKAEQYFREAVSYKQNYSGAYFYLGSLALNRNDLTSAMESYRTLISVNSGTPLGYQGVARVFMGLQQTDSALAYLNAALQLGPSPEIYQDISRAFRLKGDMENANRYMEEARKMMQGGAPQ